MAFVAFFTAPSPHAGDRGAGDPRQPRHPGRDRRRDADFVADFCRRNGVELFLYDAVQEGIEVPPRPSEDWARGLRYGWFDELAAREEAVIATAHTMSDQAETVLFRMARGTGLHG